MLSVSIQNHLVKSSLFEQIQKLESVQISCSLDNKLQIERIHTRKYQQKMYNLTKIVVLALNNATFLICVL